MYGHAHMFLPENACFCGKPGVLLSRSNVRLCGTHGLEAEEADLRAEEATSGRVPATT